MITKLKKEALEFYANSKNYTALHDTLEYPVNYDRGKLAREALAQLSLADDHPVVGRKCAICHKWFVEGDVVDLIHLQPEMSTSVAIPAHDLCFSEAIR